MFNRNTMGNCSCEVCMWFVFCGRNAFMYGDDVMRVQGVSKRRKEFEYGRTDTKMMMASIGPSRRGSLWSKHWFTKTDKLQFNIYPLRSSRMGKRKWLSVNCCTANASYYRSHCVPQEWGSGNGCLWMVVLQTHHTTEATVGPAQPIHSLAPNFCKIHFSLELQHSYYSACKGSCLLGQDAV
jgi:hypothetical protein